LRAACDPIALGFAESALDRCANQRADAAWLAAQARHPQAKLVLVAGDRVQVAGGRVEARPLAGEEPTLLLGLDPRGVPWFAAPAETLSPSADLRSIAMQGLVPPHEQGLLAQARSLVHWHQRHGFCANCGAATRSVDAGYRRRCDGCAADHFPRTDPVVIIVVRGPSGLLLGRQSSWLPGLYSALAGFMEPGETIEDAARREVFEEAGIRVGAVRYVASQPWPFPSSLMIGLLGEALSEQITPDPLELEDARWFSRAELLAMREGRDPQGRRFPAPMAIAHHLVLAALE
jgi:NAD+ diphosphatase